MYTQGERVRIYIYELGNLYGTIVQDEVITFSHSAVLVHIDGTREVDHRWIEKSHVYRPAWDGEYARNRVSECTKPYCFDIV